MAAVSESKFYEILDRVGELDVEQTALLIGAIKTYGNDKIINKQKEATLCCNALTENELFELLRYLSKQYSEADWRTIAIP